MSKTECKHLYQVQVVKRQEVHSHYVGLHQGNKAVIIENEVPIIFCVRCGDRKQELTDEA